MFWVVHNLSFNIKIFSFLLYFPGFKHDTDLFVNDTTRIVSHQQLKNQNIYFSRVYLLDKY